VQIVSDFGIGPWRKRNEEFVAKFKSVYSLTEQRIGAASTLDPATNDYMGLGGVARILFAYPGPRQVRAQRHSNLGRRTKEFRGLF
jgi:hypothetical protein